jgi:hypothetical protein
MSNYCAGTDAGNIRQSVSTGVRVAAEQHAASGVHD